ncbi:MAG: hypothetical protein J6M38_05400, partial [Lentisphaeria bacterium]|nr:hypothetical protein [Lentisphaeria bacterium]
MKFKTGLAMLIAMLALPTLSAPDYRPAFDKKPYQGTVWTQVNPWWYPSKQRIDDSGGPNYARRKFRTESEWGEAQKDSYSYGKVNWQVELNVPNSGHAHHFKQMMKQSKEVGLDIQYSIFLT